jgi:hypothetical protein
MVSRYRSLDIGTRLQVGQIRNTVSILPGTSGFSLLETVQTDSEARSTLVSTRIRALSTADKPSTHPELQPKLRMHKSVPPYFTRIHVVIFN